MEITILSISDKGDLDNERIGLKVLKECELKYYMLFSTYFHEGGFYNRSKATYWFAPCKLTVQDKVVIYTKSGSNSVKYNSDGTTTYFFYWGLDYSIFSDAKNGVVLGQIGSWETSKGK